MGLMTDHTSIRRDRDYIAEIRTPPATKTHYPISHIDFIEQTESALVERGWMIAGEWFSASSDGSNMFGVIQVKSDRPDYDILVGLRNSHTKKMSAGLLLGSHVMVCSNGAFSGEVRLARAHTKYIERDLPGVVAAGIGKIADMRVSQDRRIQSYKTTELSPSQADHLIVQMVRERILVPSHVGKVVNEWDSPRHHEFREDGLTAWRLFNACTEVLKATPMALPRRTQQLHGLIDGVCEPVPEAA